MTSPVTKPMRRTRDLDGDKVAYHQNGDADCDRQADEIDAAADGDGMPNAMDPEPVVNQADDAGSVDQSG